MSLNPLDSCWPPQLDLSDITRMEFHTRDNIDGDTNGPNGWWDDGDVLTLWFDNLRLVDQDNGAIRWQTAAGASTYYVYFDVLTHEGHSQPALNPALGAATLTGSAGTPEAGGYYHQVRRRYRRGQLAGLDRTHGGENPADDGCAGRQPLAASRPRRAASSSRSRSSSAHPLRRPWP